MMEKYDLYAKKSITINARPLNVWNILVDFNNWPEWQKGVTEAHLADRLNVGSKFFWKAQGLNIVSEIVELDKNRKIAWRGKALGMNAYHTFSFMSKNGKTGVTTEEFMSGWLVKLIKVFMPNFLNKSVENSLLTLKDKAENI